MKHLYIILLILPLIGFGQGWETILGLGLGKDVKQTTDGGYIICGNSNDSGIILIKTNENGIVEWSKSFGNSGNNVVSRGSSVQQTSDGGYIIIGQTGIYEGMSSWWDIFLIKTDVNGNEEWSQTFGEETVQDRGYSVQQTLNGGYIILGENSSGINLIKTDGNGNEVWTQTFEGDDGESFQQTSDGGYIILGYYNNIGPFLIKTDGNGNEEWTQTFGGTNSSMGDSVQQTAMRYIMTGWPIDGDSLVNKNRWKWK